MHKILLRFCVCVILVGMMTGTLSGCAMQADTGAPTVEMLAYTKGNGDSWCARELSIDLTKEEITLNEGILYEIKNEYGWSNEIFPVNILPGLFVLRGESVLQSQREYVVSAKENELWSQGYKLEYEPDTLQAVITENDQIVGVLDHLEYKNMVLIPMAFFMDQDENLVVMCQRGDEETAWNDVYPVSLVAERKNKDSSTFVIRQAFSYDDMFNETLSKMQMPFYTWFSTNIYGNAQCGAFFWNEGRSIVRINPYDGSYNVILNEERLKADMPLLDTYRESYEFFSGFSCQNGIYITVFPNYNNVSGTYAAFYNEENQFLGSVLCTEGESVSYCDGHNEERCRIEDLSLWPFLYPN